MPEVHSRLEYVSRRKLTDFRRNLVMCCDLSIHIIKTGMQRVEGRLMARDDYIVVLSRAQRNLILFARQSTRGDE